MSDNISFELQEKIIKRLPVKSLIQFRSVSKSWKSLIDSSQFIADYSTHVQHLLVTYKRPVCGQHEYVSIVDDHTFPHQKVSLMSIKNLIHATIIGISHGLICLCKFVSRDRHKTGVVVLWNPSIRKGFAAAVPNLEGMYGTTIGFGVCRETNDIKIVKISYVDHNMWKGDMESITSIPNQVEVFTLSTGTWRNSHGNLPRLSIDFKPYDEVVMDGVFYWLVKDRIAMDGEDKMIVSFDMTSEEFREITFPDIITDTEFDLSISYLGDSLVVCGQSEWSDKLIVWMMQGGVSKSFTKVFRFTFNDDAILKGFRRNGEPIVEITDISQQGNNRAQLAIYEPSSKHTRNLGIDGVWDSISVHPYMETLLLLDQPNFKVYKGI